MLNANNMNSFDPFEFPMIDFEIKSKFPTINA